MFLSSLHARLHSTVRHAFIIRVSSSFIPSFLLASLLIELTPGPNMAYLALVSATEGRRTALAATAGVALGLLTIGAAASLGLAAMVATSTLAFQVLRWAGALYLFWLAWDAWGSEREVSPGRAQLSDGSARHFRRGFITNLLNPKAGLFFVAVLPGFIDPARQVLPQSVVLIVLYVAVATAIHLAIVGLAGTARLWFDNAANRRRGRGIFALLLAAVAVWFLVRTT